MRKLNQEDEQRSFIIFDENRIEKAIENMRKTERDKSLLDNTIFGQGNTKKSTDKKDKSWMYMIK